MHFLQKVLSHYLFTWSTIDEEGEVVFINTNIHFIDIFEDHVPYGFALIYIFNTT